MRGRYRIDGSNTLFKVWGIILLVFTALGGVLLLLGMILLFAGSAMLTSYVDDYSPFMDSYSRAMMGSVSGSVMGVMIILFLIVAAILAVAAMAGILLVRDYIKAKDTLVVFAVLYFTGAAFTVIAFIFGIAARAGIGVILGYLFAMLWRVATGVILLLKHKRAVPASNIMPGQLPGSRPLPGPVPAPFPSGAGTIEGMFGVLQGKQFEVYTGRIYKIGREPCCEIRVNHPKVSRIHCTVCKLHNGRYQITDSSSNGTYYDNNKLQKGIATEVNAGGLLVLGEADNVLQLI